MNSSVGPRRDSSARRLWEPAVGAIGRSRTSAASSRSISSCRRRPNPARVVSDGPTRTPSSRLGRAFAKHRLVRVVVANEDDPAAVVTPAGRFDGDALVRGAASDQIQHELARDEADAGEPSRNGFDRRQPRRRLLGLAIMHGERIDLVFQPRARPALDDRHDRAFGARNDATDVHALRLRLGAVVSDDLDRRAAQPPGHIPERSTRDDDAGIAARDDRQQARG